MTDPGPTPERDGEIERLVRASLDRASERVDPRPLFERITAEIPGATPRRRKSGIPWQLTGLAASIVAVVAICFPIARRDRPAYAKGETVVREARQAHLQPVDRCYLVEVRRESPLAAELAPNLPQVRQTRLWTRGDRFWVESVRPDQRWAWGRDEANRFWVAFGPRAAIRFDADEVPDWLSLFCDLHSLNLERWLGDVADRFDLAREDAPADESASTIRIKATARSMPAIGPAVRSAELEVDAETRVIRRLVVHRVWDGDPLATVVYSLVETGALDPEEYQVEGHLSDPYDVFTRDHEPRRRKELVVRWFGNRPLRWLRPDSSSKRH